MTIHELIISDACIQACESLVSAGLGEASTTQVAEYAVLHPVFCSGRAGQIHNAYHRERSKMRRMAACQRGRLSRPQRRRWQAVATDFQWLWDRNLIWLPAIERNGTTCFDCHACDHVLSKYWDRWANYPN